MNPTFAFTQSASPVGDADYTKYYTKFLSVPACSRQALASDTEGGEIPRITSWCLALWDC